MRDAMRPQSETHVRIADATDGRTNVTKKSHTAESILTVCNARARDDLGVVTLGELLASAPQGPASIDEADVELIASLLAERSARHSPSEGKSIAWILDKWADRMELLAGRRWPVIRSGEREPIPWLLRASIYSRDGRTCKACGSLADGYLELDHCIPWSAGGPDDSDNLRTLCSGCNQRRSNYIDLAHLTTLLPTTYWCIDCWTYETRKPRHPWRDGTYTGDAPLVGDGDRPFETVFCSHCLYISQSDVYFIGDRGRDLIARATRYVREVRT